MSATLTHEDRMLAAATTPESARLIVVARELLHHLIGEGMVPAMQDEAEEAKAVGHLILKLVAGEAERVEEFATAEVYGRPTPVRDAVAGLIWNYHNA